MTNPFFEDWATPYAVPPFAEIKDEHFKPAYLAALEEHRAEIAAIAGNAEAPTFSNTIEALELSGKRLDRVDLVFSQLTSANTNETLQAIELELAPQLARHWTSIYLDPTLFARVDALYAQRESLGLSSEARRVLERYHLDFVRAGAKLSAADRARSGEIAEWLSVLGTMFGQNVLADEQNTVFGLEEAEVAGLPESALSAAAETARDRQLNAPYAVTTSRSSVEPVLHLAANRAVREEIWRAFVKRGGNGNAHDNHAVIAEILQLRAELAALLGYESYAHFKLDDTMAGSPAAARELLEQVWAPGRQRVIDDRADLQAIADAEGGDFAIAPWDWRYYADKLRMARYDFDENAIKPYLLLENVVEAAFFVAGKLFGVSFAPRADIAGYHPDVRVWEVMRGGKTIGIFYGDFYARPGKRSGAWMTSFRKQSKLGGVVLPLIVNTCNFMKPSEGKPALLSLDEARTVFHEFGHGLHGLLSNVTYPRISGTSVVRDFVELPSQIYEHWLESKPVLERLVHYRTGEPIPEALLAKLKAASNANQGFATVEFVSSAILDMDLHSRTLDANVDVAALEQETLNSIAMPAEIALRHASPHFLHLFSGDGYAAGYYSYLWSEVLDADGYEAFEEAGDPFDPTTAEKLYTYIYSAGGSRDFSEAYRLFRGRDPDVKALLQGRGLAGIEALEDGAAR
jgi:peptidyl-dipeptidase Dcp